MGLWLKVRLKRKNSWFLVFGFQQGSAVKPRFWTFFSVNYCFFALQPRIRVFKPGFQNPRVSNKNWYIFHFPGQTLKSPKSKWQFLFGLNKRASEVKYVKGFGYIGISTSISRIVKLTFYHESIWISPWVMYNVHTSVHNAYTLGH